MPVKGSGPATEWREIDRWEHGVGWIAHPDEMMSRASHAVEVNGDVWLVDPVDAEGIDDLITELGDVAGVVVLLDRHTRDANVIADRYDVAVHVPEWLSGVEKDLEVPVEQSPELLADTSYTFLKVLDYPMMKEAALYDEQTGTLVVADALGTAGYFVTDSERIGVNPMLRLFPPKRLAELSPSRILPGHGEGIHEDATQALADAYAGARRRAPSLYAGTTYDLIFG